MPCSKTISNYQRLFGYSICDDDALKEADEYGQYHSSSHPLLYDGSNRDDDEDGIMTYSYWRPRCRIHSTTIELELEAAFFVAKTHWNHHWGPKDMNQLCLLNMVLSDSWAPRNNMASPHMPFKTKNQFLATWSMYFFQNVPAIKRMKFYR